jgi:hypothetical protein
LPLMRSHKQVQPVAVFASSAGIGPAEAPHARFGNPEQNKRSRETCDSTLFVNFGRLAGTELTELLTHRPQR